MLTTVRTRVPSAIAAGAAALLVATLLPGATFAQKALATQSAGTTVLAAHSGQALDVSGVSQAAGAPVIQWPPNGGDNQRWKFESLGDGTHRIVVAHSGQVLDVAGASLAPGAPIIQWPWNGGDNQRWRIEDVPGEGDRLVAVHSGQALDVAGASQARGARVVQWPANGGANQRWQHTDDSDPVDTGDGNGRLDADDVLSPGIDTRPDVGESSPPMVSVTDVRLGRHNGFDRIVFEVGGKGQAGWDVRYVDEARSAGSGFPVDVEGGAILKVILRNIALPPDAPTGVEPWDGPERLHPGQGDGPVAEVVEDTVYEGQHTFFIGLTDTVPFQVHRLGSPQRVVVDVAE